MRIFRGAVCILFGIDILLLRVINGGRDALALNKRIREPTVLKKIKLFTCSVKGLCVICMISAIYEKVIIFILYFNQYQTLPLQKYRINSEDTRAPRNFFSQNIRSVFQYLNAKMFTKPRVF